MKDKITRKSVMNFVCDIYYNEISSSIEITGVSIFSLGLMGHRCQIPLEKEFRKIQIDGNTNKD